MTIKVKIMIKTAYDVFKELEKEPPQPEYGENFGQLDKDSWGTDVVVNKNER
jgi:hypothetical protein